MTRTQRLAARRARRLPVVLALIGITAMLAIVMAALVSSAAEVQAEPTAGRQVDTLRTYDYNDARQWQPSMDELCIQNEAAGFPVLSAAAEFSAYVPMTVRDDCADAAHVVYVQLVNDADWPNSAWFDSTRDEDGYVTAGRIRLNVAQAFRLSPDGWRSILIHELGHALGLGHPDHGAHSIMDPIDYADHDGLTELDHEQLAEMWEEGGSQQ